MWMLIVSESYQNYYNGAVTVTVSTRTAISWQTLKWGRVSSLGESVDVRQRGAPQSRQSARLFLKSSELAPAHTCKQVPPPPFGFMGGGGGHTHMRERGRGEQLRTIGEKAWYSVYCVVHPYLCPSLYRVHYTLVHETAYNSVSINLAPPKMESTNTT